MTPLSENQTVISSQQHNSAADSEAEDFENISSQPAPAFSISSGEDTSNTSREEGSSFELPFNLGIVSDVKTAYEGLMKLRTNGIEVIEVLEGRGGMSDVNDLKKDSSEILSNMGELYKDRTTDKKLTEEQASDLSELAEKFRKSYSPKFGEVVIPVSDQYDKVSKFQKIDPKSAEIANALREAYKNDDTTLITQIGDMISQVEQYNSYFEKASKFASSISSTISNSKLMEDLKGYSGEVTSLAENVKSGIDVAVELNKTYDAIGNAGADLSGPVEGMNSVFNLMDRGFESLADVPGFKIISALWVNCYGPAVDFCMEGIGQIAKLKEKGFEDIAKVIIKQWNEHQIGENNNAPTQVKDTIERTFPSGWEVFNFMWNVMCSEGERLPNDTVVEYFEDNYTRINGASGDNDSIPTKGITPFWSIDPQELMGWAITNKFVLWALFYGTTLPYPAKTVA